MNRPILAGADGCFTLRTGRLYRLLLVVLDAPEIHGTPTADELAEALLKIGFHGHDLALSMNGNDWAHERPPDWPDGAVIPSISANEHQVRASGSFTGGHMRVLRDTPIAGGSTLTIVQAWDYGPALAPGAREAVTTTGASNPSVPDRSNVVVIGVLAVTGIAAWNFMRTGQRFEREEEKFFSLEARAERARMGARIRDLMSSGYAQKEAEDVAAYEHIATAEHAELEAELEAAERTG
jgi:hypothetical protein